jgi:23S rRNA pseudouridine2605 synthase
MDAMMRDDRNPARGAHGADEAIGDVRVVPMRLQKFLARAGAASRRGSENLMTAGRVRVNGIIVTELGSKVDPRVDVVEVDGTVVKLGAAPVTLALNKPTGYVTTMSDPQGRSCVAHLVPVASHPGLYPIGRLDRDTTGLLLFSTDGELGNALLHPSHHVTKVYLATVEGGAVGSEALRHLREGVLLDDGMTAPADASVRSRNRDSTVLRIAIHEGRKRQVRRMCKAVGHPVTALERISFGPIALGSLPSGSWRELSASELAALYAAAGKPC